MRITLTEARTKLPELVRMTEGGDTVELTKYGSTQAVLISVENWERYKRTLMGSTT